MILWKKMLGTVSILLLCMGLIPDTQAALICGDFIPRMGSSIVSHTAEAGRNLWRAGQEALSLTHEPMLTAYQVQPGDTLWEIAFLQGISCEELMRMNPGAEAECLQIGETLMLPQRTWPVREVKRASVSRGLDTTSGFIWPLTGTITSPFGAREPGTHHGIDIAGNTGDKVRAAAGGTVSKVQWHDIYGNMILLDHTDGQQTLYAHLSKTLVTPGERVAKGQIIGEVGSTGRSTGPHLHFEVRKEQIAINPMPYLPR